LAVLAVDAFDGVGLYQVENGEIVVRASPITSEHPSLTANALLVEAKWRQIRGNC
jgi:hypothetical protein